jgi:hypothetical protein
MILVIIGVLFLLNNFNLINFDWYTFIHLWPIVLIIAGVNLVFAHNRTPLATGIKILVLLAGMGVLIWGGVTQRNYHHFDYSFNTDDDDKGDSTVTASSDNNFSEPFKPVIQNAHLNISGGATGYTLSDTTTELFSAQTNGRSSAYSLKTTIDSTTEVLDFSMGSKKHHGFSLFGRHNNNHVDFKLNSKPVWDIDVEAGASSFKFDLSKFKVQKLTFQGGAASFDIKMGEPLATTNVDIQAGASSINISVPQNAACQITTDTGLSSKSFNGFDKKGDDKYQTPGFDQATKKIYIHIEGGMADFKVSRY